jgi:hypothetical protein
MDWIIKLLLIVSLFVSCDREKKVATYTYDDMTVTRFENTNRTTFYFSSPLVKDGGRIWVNYSGIDSYFEVMLKFDTKNNEVTIIPCDAYLESEGLDTTYFKIGRLNFENMKVNPFGVVNRNYENLEFYTVIPSTRYEKERNLKTKTKVKAIYYDKNSD